MAAPQQHQLARTTHTISIQYPLQSIDPGHRLVVVAYDQVTDFEPRDGGGTCGFDAAYAHSRRLLQFMMTGDATRKRRCEGGHADPGAAHAAVLQQLAEHPLRGIAGGRKADALRTGDDCRVYADHGPARVDQRSTGIAGIKCGVGLDDIVDQPSGARTQAPSQGTDDARRDRMLEAKRIADGNGQLADSQRGGACEVQMW